MNKYVSIFKNWFAYAAITTVLCGIIYIVTQQNYRLTANDPQYQMAEDAANAINNGAEPRSLVSSAVTVEISKSLAPFLVIYDAPGNVIASNATLNGKAIEVPKGVLDYVQKNGTDMASWQPQPGVRQAMVAIRAAKGREYTVVTGRSLRKIEERIALLGQQVLFGWFVSLIGLFVVAVIQDWIGKKYS